MAELLDLDIASLLESASQQLGVGEMINSADFDLHHVMSAVEIGDPRLDAGVAPFVKMGCF